MSAPPAAATASENAKDQKMKTEASVRRSRSKSPCTSSAGRANPAAARRSRSPIDLTSAAGSDGKDTKQPLAVKVELTPIRVVDVNDYKTENGGFEESDEYERNVERHLKDGQVRVMCSIRFEDFFMASSILERLAATALKRLVPMVRSVCTAPFERDTCVFGTVLRVTPAAVRENPNVLWKSWESVQEVGGCCIAYSKYVRHCGFGGDREHEVLGVLKKLNTADPNPVLITAKEHSGVVLFFPQLTVAQFHSSGADEESADDENDDEA